MFSKNKVLLLPKPNQNAKTKVQYATTHAKAVIYKNEFDVSMSAHVSEVWPMRTDIFEARWSGDTNSEVVNWNRLWKWNVRDIICA